MHDFDLIVIGAGPGGYPAAIRSAQLGKKTAIIEKEAPGGTCLNWGCIPTKTLIASADQYNSLKKALLPGITAKDVRLDYASMVKRKNEVVTKLNSGIKFLLKSNGVEYIQGTARFESSDRISVEQSDGTRQWLRSTTTIIATGSESAMPGFLPRNKRVKDSRAFLDLTTLPNELLILGGGVIGCEFACMTAALGVKVTVVEMLDDIIMLLDPDLRRVLRRSMESAGIKILTGAPLTDIKADKDGVSGKFKEQTLRADMLLVSVGRTPCTQELQLSQAGVNCNDRGFIPVNQECRTNVPSIFAIGDLTAGSVQLAHAATQQGVTAAECAAGIRNQVEELCPSCIFTSPEIGCVGLSESVARTKGIPVKKAIFPFSALGKAMAANHTTGFVKFIAEPDTNVLLGAHVIGANATELIATATLAIRNELTAAEVGNTIHSHPTMSEAWMEAANALRNTAIHLPPT